MSSVLKKEYYDVMMTRNKKKHYEYRFVTDIVPLQEHSIEMFRLTHCPSYRLYVMGQYALILLQRSQAYDLYLTNIFIRYLFDAKPGITSSYFTR